MELTVIGLTAVIAVLFAVASSLFFRLRAEGAKSIKAIKSLCDELEKERRSKREMDTLFNKTVALHAEEMKKAKAEKAQETYDCRQLLNDLTKGAGVVQITPISPLDIFIRRS